MGQKINIGIVMVVTLLVVSFTALVWALMNVYTDMQAKEMEMRTRVSEIRVDKDPELLKQINALKKSLELTKEENMALSGKVAEIEKKEDALKRNIDDKLAQIGRLRAEQKRLEGSMKDRESEYESKINAAMKEKEEYEAMLNEERNKAKDIVENLLKERQGLQDHLETKADENVALVNTMNNLSNANLVQETAKMHYNMATLFMQSKKYDEAVHEYQRAINLDPTDADAHYNLALVYDIYLNDQVAAIEQYKKCLECEPDYKNKKAIQERIVALALQETVKISPTTALRRDEHKLELETVELPPRE